MIIVLYNGVIERTALTANWYFALADGSQCRPHFEIDGDPRSRVTTVGIPVTPVVARKRALPVPIKAPSVPRVVQGKTPPKQGPVREEDY